MRALRCVCWVALGWTLLSVEGSASRADVQRRQASSDTAFPSLTTNDPSASSLSTDNSASATNTVTSAIPPSIASTQFFNSTTSSTKASTSTSLSTTRHVSSTTARLSSPSSTAIGNVTTTSATQQPDALPIQPRITPAFGFAGVFLIVLGATYAMVGVRSRWIHIFLSCGFLASIAATVLVDYVMNTPVTDAVQGGFFVAIFMTGVVLGAGALVFKEITEGFACLLGGFCLSMWLLTLRPGGLITSSGGKGVFIGIFCIGVWALSFTHYTRPYALIGSIPFSGATALTLGIDCFTRAGLKEFWFYIWNLNDNLFPLNTDTFPLTRGIKVEIAIIVIGTILGILAQLKLWKVLRSKEREQEAQSEEGSRQREAVEVALGRHLQRQNDREKSQWERQYGNRLSTQRNTVLWQTAHPEKQYPAVSVAQVDQDSRYSSIGGVEMGNYGQMRSDSTADRKVPRQSTLTVNAIQEEDEDDETVAERERRKALRALERPGATPSAVSRQHSRESLIAGSAPSASRDDGSDQPTSADAIQKARDPSRLKRLSQHSLSRISKHLSVNYNSNSESQEHLIDVERPHSRASSAAATLDIENEDLDIKALDAEPDREVQPPPNIIGSPADDHDVVKADPVEAHNEFGHQQDTSTPSTENNPEPFMTPNAHAEGARSENASDESHKDEDGEAKPASETKEPEDSLSHTSDITSSSADTLTKTALASVPTQLSSVVLSYRTNEWAKHIAVAEEPIYDEPETIEGIDDELPTQLAPASEGSGSEEAASSAIGVPQATDFPATVRAGVGIAAKPPTTIRSFSDQERRRSSVKAPARTSTSQSLRTINRQAQRSSLNPYSLVSTPIDEDAPMEFVGMKKIDRRESAPYVTLRSSSNSRPHTAISMSPLTSTHNSQQVSRPVTRQSQRPATSLGTRMDSHNSHLPPQRDLQTDAQKRETLLADWRLSRQHRAASTGLSGGVSPEQGRAQMQADKDNQRLREEFHRHSIQRKQQAMDQLMRRPDMQDLHREAMRKMQARANNKLRSATS